VLRNQVSGGAHTPDCQEDVVVQEVCRTGAVQSQGSTAASGVTQHETAKVTKVQNSPCCFGSAASSRQGLVLACSLTNLCCLVHKLQLCLLPARLPA
jgi:hypothetical protein